MSICSIEEVAKILQSLWFQLYVMRDHDFAKLLVEGQKRRNAPHWCLLGLTNTRSGHADIRNGLSVPMKIKCQMFWI